MTDEAKKALADKIAHADGLSVHKLYSQSGCSHQTSLNKSERDLILAALRSQPGTLAREEVALMALKKADLLSWGAFQNGKPTPNILAFTDAILALIPSHEAGTQEPVAWYMPKSFSTYAINSTTQKTIADIWRGAGETVVALYAAPQPASVAQAKPDCGESTCYLERSKVRGLLIGHADEDTGLTELILSDIDALPIITASDMKIAALALDENYPDCATSRERELYDALMGLSSAITVRERRWDDWFQGGVLIAPIVHKALRLDGPSVSSTEGQTRG